jgi:GNAT-family acetyltransferase (TIGR03103 family)
MAADRSGPAGERRPAADLRPRHLTGVPGDYDALNAYSRIIVDEALRRGIAVEVFDAARGGLRLRHGGRVVRTFESLSELTTAVAFRICDDKRLTREVLERVGIPVPPGRTATFDDADEAFLAEHGELVVKPARGEGGAGITVGVTTADELDGARHEAGGRSADVVLEAHCRGEDLRVVVIAGEVVAASVRYPAAVVGDGRLTVEELIRARSEERQAATGGASRIPLDDTTQRVVAQAGHSLDDVLDEGVTLRVRRTANLHTGGTIQDVTDRLHPALAVGAVAVAWAIDIPVVGVDLVVEGVDRPDFVVIEANEQPGLANHEPQPTAERFVDLLFPNTRGLHQPPERQS